jgi:hypothetical protein
MKTEAAPEGAPSIWTLAFGQHEDRRPTHGYEARRRWRHSLRVGEGSEGIWAIPDLVSATGSDGGSHLGTVEPKRTPGT